MEEPTSNPEVVETPASSTSPVPALRKRHLNPESRQDSKASEIDFDLDSAGSCDNESADEKTSGGEGLKDAGGSGDHPRHRQLSASERNRTASSSSPGNGDGTPAVLQKLSDRWRNWVIRGFFTWLMIFGFCGIIYLGPMALMVITLAVQVKCFAEIINIGYSVYRVHNLPWFRSLSWYFLVTSNYFFYGESLVEDYFGIWVNRVAFLGWLVKYHRFVSFCMYIVGFVWFVLSLVKKYYMRQFSLFAWTHVALLLVVTQSYLIIQNIFEGMIWFIVPVSMIICNDVMAYMFGFFMGRTPLIKLSPKKTWEGFIGGGISTVIFGLIFSYFLCQYPFFVCTVQYEYVSEDDTSATNLGYDCEPSYMFQLQRYELPIWVALFRMKPYVTMYPFMLHSLSMSVFSSVIGPFGGFFASGFKRAFKIKDFGDVIPGHGGILDRFDCQFLMATFVNVYIYSFIRTASPQKLLQQVLMLKPEQQLQMYYTLQENLGNRGILQLPRGAT